MFSRSVLFLLALSFVSGGFLPTPAMSQEATTLKVAEKNVGDALALALKLAARRKIKFPGKGMRGILNDEVAPHSGQFVSSYKVLGGSGRGWINLEASVDVTALRSIFSINHNNFKAEKPNALIMVRGHNGNATWRGAAYDENEEALAILLETAVADRLRRRGISVLPRVKEYLDFVDELDRSSGPAMRAIAEKVGADLVFYIEPSFRNSTKPGASGLRFYLKGVAYDRERDLVLGANEQAIPMWMGERAVTSKNEKVLETVTQHIDSSVHELFMLSGAKLHSTVSSTSYLTVRVLSPPSFISLDQFREGVSQLKGVRFIVERKVTPNFFDFWIDTDISTKRLRKELRGLSLNDFKVALDRGEGAESSSEANISLRLERKADSSDSKRSLKERNRKGA